MRIAIANDLALAREALRLAVLTDQEHSIAWLAVDGGDAVKKCAADRPDLMLMDLLMPGLNGVAATRRIMTECPCPVLVVTSTIAGNFSLVYEALGAGAVDAVETPSLANDGSLKGVAPLLKKINDIRNSKRFSSSGLSSVDARPRTARQVGAQPAIVAIGASTGGPQALLEVLMSLPVNLPAAVVMAQHINCDFVQGLADWLSEKSHHQVKLARPGEVPAAGQIRLAGRNDHLELSADGAWKYNEEPRDNPFRPSVNSLFNSLVRFADRPGIAVLLTGMGRDGAQGLLNLRKSGWFTIAQDEATSAVWGMPQAAVNLQAAQRVVPLAEIGQTIVQKLAGATRP